MQNILYLLKAVNENFYNIHTLQVETPFNSSSISFLKIPRSLVRYLLKAKCSMPNVMIGMKHDTFVSAF